MAINTARHEAQLKHGLVQYVINIARPDPASSGGLVTAQYLQGYIKTLARQKSADSCPRGFRLARLSV